MIALGKSAAGILAAVGRIVWRDPLTVFAALPIEPARQRLRYRADVDTWELRLMAVSGKPRDEVRCLIEALPTDCPDFPDLRVLAWAYDMLCRGAAWEELADAAERDRVPSG